MKSPNSSGRLEFAGPEIKVGLDAAKAAPSYAKKAAAPMSKKSNKMDGMDPKMPKDKKMIMSAPAPKPKRLPKRK